MSGSFFRADLLAGKVALVTGGGTGIGKAIVEAFIQHGARVAIMGRRREVVQATAAQLCARYGSGTCAAFSADVRNAALVKQTVEEIVAQMGRLDILVNNAAGNFLCSLEDITSKGFQTVLEIDLMGTFNVSKAAYEALKSSGKGSIINISATFHYSAMRYQAHASSAKAGVDALTRSIAVEWAPTIRCNGVAPGPIGDTEGMSRLAPGAMAEAVASSIPLHRVGTVEDVAHSCLFLASEAAAYITGHTLVVDGGSWIFQQSTIPPAVYEAIRGGRAAL
jgi:peroxisomal 2,4-dienoyl-CoA reductase